MATLKNIFDKCGVALYQNESLDLDHYYQEPYQDEGDEIKAIGKPFETNDSNKIRKYDLFAEDRTFSNFSFFMDGSRRTYKIGDKTPKARYLDFNQGVDGRKINDDNMTQLARLAIKPLRIAFDDIKLKDTYCAAVRTAHRHGIKEISNYILFNYKDKPEDLYERLKINIELNRELGIQIFSFPMKYSPINRTDRSYIGVNWTKKSIRAISAILQVTKGVVAAGSDFFYKAFGNTLEEYFELLAMPRELIMFRHHFEENGTTAEWKKLYQSMSDEQKKELMEFTSHTVAELKQTPCPEQFREILPYYLIKYNGKKEQMGDGAVQLSLMDDSDIVVEDQ